MINANIPISGPRVSVSFKKGKASEKKLKEAASNAFILPVEGDLNRSGKRNKQNAKEMLEEVIGELEK